MIRGFARRNLGFVFVNSRTASAEIGQRARGRAGASS